MPDRVAVFVDGSNVYHALKLAFGSATYSHRRSRYEKGVDVKIATDLVAMAHADKYDIAVLVSADGDLAPAVREVRWLGRVVENAMPKARRSWHLFHESSKFLEITRELFDRCAP